MERESQFVGESGAFLDAVELASRAAELDRPVLVIGERGTGKELIAERLHRLSQRWEGPLITLNCAALPETLIEAELFGHEAGAFTGATRARAGAFEEADGGTLFLDELATLSAAAQERLLRAVEYGEVTRIGSNKPLQVDARIVAATNENLPGLVESNRFRADLLDRLSFEVVTLPPLRVRESDILILADYFGRRMGVELDWPAWPGFGDDAVAALMAHDWPGNVRELRNGVAAMLRDDGELALPAPATAVCEEATEVAGTGAQKTIDDTRCPPGSRALASISTLSDREFLTAWQASDYEVARMARDFGVSRQSVYRRVQKLEQCRLATDVPLEELLGALQRCRGDLAATARGLAVSCAGLKQRLRNSALESQLRDLRSSRGVSRQTD